MRAFALFVLAPFAVWACAALGSSPKSAAELAPEARAALERVCKADAAAVDAGLKKSTPKVDEACEVVRAVCVE